MTIIRPYSGTLPVQTSTTTIRFLGTRPAWQVDEERAEEIKAKIAAKFAYELLIHAKELTAEFAQAGFGVKKTGKGVPQSRKRAISLGSASVRKVTHSDQNIGFIRISKKALEVK